MDKEKFRPIPIFIGVLLEIAVTLLFVSIFALIMKIGEIDYKYSPVLGSIAIALGSFANSLYLSKIIGSRGYLIGFAVGLITFIIITLVGLAMNDGGLTLNTLFHFIIFTLSAVTGGVIGVNKTGKKYI